MTDRHGAVKKTSKMERRFVEAMAPLHEDAREGIKPPCDRKNVSIGIPRCLYNLVLEPLWYEFLTRLGFTVIVSDQKGSVMEDGEQIVNSDFCAPMILSHGTVKQLFEDGAQYVFYPAVVNEREGSSPVSMSFRKRETDNAYCYYSQYLSSIVDKLTAFSVEDRLISPLIRFREQNDNEVTKTIHAELFRRFPDVSLEETREAYAAARRSFDEAKAGWRSFFAKQGDAESGNLRIVLMGRPYVAFDPNLHHSIPLAFEELGAEVYWQDELDNEGILLTYANRYLERMHWEYGKRIIRIAELAAKTPNLYPVFLTCFRCSPDSFLMSYIRDIFSRFGKPFLILQLDAHASDVGYITRIEAALESFRNHRKRETAARSSVDLPRSTPSEETTHARNDPLQEGDTVLIAAVDNLISRFWADSFAWAGHEPVLLEATESGLNLGYRFASGGECMPLVYIIGSAIERVQRANLDPRKLFFFMPTTPLSCNFPQFPILADTAFRAAGLEDVRIGLINFMSPGDSLPQTLAIKILESYIVACVLYKLSFRIRPYEKNRGDTEHALAAAELIISEAIRSGAELRTALTSAAELFRAVPRDESKGRKPRIALLGDLYVKYNEAVNGGIHSLIEELDGEVILSSMSEYAAHMLDIGARMYGENPRSTRMLRTVEGRYEKIVEDLVGDQAEPDFSECVALMEDYGIKHYLAGETSINVGRALWYCTHHMVEAIVHVNPMFCCPGVVSASLFRKIQEDFGIPIVDIFYDGAKDPNRALIPHLHYLGKEGWAALSKP